MSLNKSIAVLPFRSIGSSQECKYFSEGISEEIINALIKIKGLKVSSRASSFLFDSTKVSIKEIAELLGVNIILEGSIRLSGDKARISVRLIEASEDFCFWTETFDRKLTNIFEVQDEISLSVADKLREHVGHIELGNNLVTSYNISISDYKQYLKGRYFIMKLNYPNVLKGIAIMEEVHSKAPDFPLACLEINKAYAYLGTMGIIPAVEAFVKAAPYLKKAIDISENLPDTQLNMAWISCWQNWDINTAYKHLQNAVSTKPSDEIYLSISNILAIEGRFGAAHTYIDKALDLDPFSAMNHHFKGFIYYLQEEYSKAIPQFKKSLEYESTIPFPHLAMGLSLLLKGEIKAGLRNFENMSESKFGDLTRLGGLTLAYVFAEDKVNIDLGIKELQSKLGSESMGSALFFLILINAKLGNDKEALELVEKGIEMKFPNMLLLFTEPFTKCLYSYDKFREIKENIFGTDKVKNIENIKEKKPLLDSSQLEKHKDRLETMIVESKNYLDSSLSLRLLSQQLEIPANHLSYLLNKGFDKNFSEFINTYRIEEFKNRVANKGLDNLTILALAYDSGFNSKTVFNTFFKKITGKTPKDYCKEIA